MKKIILLVIAAGLILFVTTCDTVENDIDKLSFKGKVVYVTYYDDSPKTELTIMDIDGTNKRIIDTSEKFYLNEPSWAADGKKMIYGTRTSIYGSIVAIIDEGGKNKMQIYHKGGSAPLIGGDTPKFSSNGKYFLYNHINIAGITPIIFKLEDSTVVIISRTADVYDVGPNPWTSDNRKVLLSAQLERYGNYGLYFVDITTGYIDTIITSSQRLFNRPLLSRDENEIIYSTSYTLMSSTYGTLKRLDIKTKNTTELKFSVPNLKILHPKYWTKDKRFLLFTVKNDSKKEFIADLLYHDFLTGKTEYLLRNISYDIDVWMEE